MGSARSRRSGVNLDAARLDYELALRGVTARRLAQVAGVSEVTLSWARHGRPVAQRTLRRITEGLIAIPLLAGAERLVTEPEKTIAAVSGSAATGEGSRVSGRTSAAV